MIPQPTAAYFTPSDAIRKVLNAAEHSFRANATSLVVSTALRFKLAKRMISPPPPPTHTHTKTTIIL